VPGLDGKKHQLVLFICFIVTCPTCMLYFCMCGTMWEAHIHDSPFVDPGIQQKIDNDNKLQRWKVFLVQCLNKNRL